MRRFNFANLMAKKIKLLFACGLGCVERRVFIRQRLQFPKMLLIFGELFFRARERIEQVELLVRREQRLMIMRAVKIDERVTDALQDRQGGGRTVDELAIRSTRGKRALNNKIIAARFDASFDQLWIQPLQFLAGKNRFRRAGLGSGANERLVRAFAKKELERADDDR